MTEHSVQLNVSGELLSEEIDEVLRVSEGYKGFGIAFEVQNRSDPLSSGCDWSIGPLNSPSQIISLNLMCLYRLSRIISSGPVNPYY